MQNLATAEEKPNPRGHYGPAVSAAAPSASPPSATVAALAEDGDKDAQDSDSMGVYDDDLSPPPKRELSHQRGRFRKLPSEALPGAAENAQTADRVQQSGIVRPPTPFAQR